MIKIDVNEERDSGIRLHNLEGMNETYTFYYDETNNGRKFHMEDGKFNILVNQNFILGGILHYGKHTDIDPTELFKNLKLQKSIKEVKFKHIVNGEFIDALKEEKLNLVLKWIDSKDLYLHYFNVNPLYFAFVDIIDSAIVGSNTSAAFSLGLANQVKNDLYLVLNENINRTVEIFYKYGYPSIDENEIVDFIDDIIELIEPYRENQKSHLGIETARQILKAAKKARNAPFIMNEKRHVFLDDYASFYTDPLIMFKNSVHYFDEEKKIEMILKDYRFIDNGINLEHYEFINSKTSGFIQLSDIMVGLLGKMYTFIRTNSVEFIEETVKNLTELETENLKLISRLTWKSNNECRGFLHNSISMDEHFKESVLLPEPFMV